MARKPVGVGIIGLGTVGGGVVKLLQDMPISLQRRKNAVFSLEKIAIREKSKNRMVSVDQKILTEDVTELLDHPNIDMVVELTGAPSAYDWVRGALERGKNVVTANKALLAEHGEELYKLAVDSGADLMFEASVAGGIPVVKCLRNGLVANRIESLYGILNGTTNYILTRMSRGEGTFAEILADAQEIGYAEPDPTMDVSGRDAAQKLAILSRIAFCSQAVGAEVFCEGIEHLEPIDISYATELGYVIKLLAISKRVQSGVEMRVHPAMVPADSLLGNINNEFNAVEVVGSSVGNQVFYGKGAGQMPTASAVVADMVELAERKADGASPFITDMLIGEEGLPMANLDTMEIRYFLRMQAIDKPGVLEQIANLLSARNISIASVLQKERDVDGGYVPLIIVTHEAREMAMRQSVEEINNLSVVHGEVRVIRIEELQ
ncbi:MAG: homoserine dehydrogenase [Candidatus Latescibacterota bacterium]|nr:homoserine dehydrogenase [Candidatus Latescibacterota bacterium]